MTSMSLRFGTFLIAFLLIHNPYRSAAGTLLAWGSGPATNCLADLTNVVAISAGGDHALALLADGTVKAWGNNSYQQIEIPATATNVVAVSAGFYHNLALRADGTVVHWGANNQGQGPVPASLTNVMA